MTEAVIVSTARTGLAKSWKGAFNATHGATLGGAAVRAAVDRANIALDEVEDVVMGCATPEGATGGNIARQIALRAGCPVSVPGMTINRFCSSGLQTIATAAQRIIAGENDILVAGGVRTAASSLGLVFGRLDGDGRRGFQPPLATLHGFQGWSDVIGATPADGVRDIYLRGHVVVPLSRPMKISGEAMISMPAE